jgi:hypothetical protein
LFSSAEPAAIPAGEAALNLLIGCATKASVVWERLAGREGVTIPGVEPGGCGLRLGQVAAGARAVAEMGVRASRAPEDGEADRAWLTPQQATEMWQAGAVELSPASLPALVGLLGALCADKWAGSNLAGNNLAWNNGAGNNLAGNNLAGNNPAGNNLAGNKLAGNNRARSDLAGNDLAGNNRAPVAALCTLRLLTVHLLFLDRCALDAAAALDENSISPDPSPHPIPNNAKPTLDLNPSPSPEIKSTPELAPTPTPGPAPLRRHLLDSLIELILTPPLHSPQALAEAIQAEAILSLTAGLRALFPFHDAQIALIHACVVRQQASPSPGLASLIHALCAAIGAQSMVSRLVVPSEDDLSPETLCTMLPRALLPTATPFEDIQSTLRGWLLRTVIAEAVAAVATEGPPLYSPDDHGAPPLYNPAVAAEFPYRYDPAVAAEIPANADDRSPCMRLLASLVQELVARASLCAHHRDAPNAALAGMAEDLLLAATSLLGESLAPAYSATALDAQQMKLAPTFIGSLLPWLVDSLTLFSAFAFEHAQRLLPLVLPLLHSLRAALAPGRGSISSSRSPPELAQHTLLQSAHPYKQAGEAGRKGSRRAVPAAMHAEEGAWPGATQLQLRFDSQCCTEEGDWLTLTFYRQGQPVPGRTLRLGGPWANWPKTPFTVPADAVRATFVYSPFSSQPHERWGYSISVTASRKDKTCELTTPPLEQLRISLTYLGAKCAALLVAAEPVVAEEKENRHWLQSPLFERGLPLQLPADHSLMHPFFGIQPSTSTRGSAALAFLDDLVGLRGGPATLLHRTMSGKPQQVRASVVLSLSFCSSLLRAGLVWLWWVSWWGCGEAWPRCCIGR